MTESPPTDSLLLDHVATRDLMHGFARLHSLVVVSDPEGRIVWMSEALSAECGGARPPLGRHLCEVFASLPGALAQHPKLKAQISQIQSHLRHNDNLADFRLDLGARNGAEQYVDLSVFKLPLPENLESNGRTGPLAVTILHPKPSAIDSATREEEEACASILAQSPDAVLAIGSTGFINFANPATATLLGREHQKIVGQPIALFLLRAPHLMQSMSNLHSTNAGFAMADELVEFERPDGLCRWISISTRPRVGKDGRSGGHLLFIRDVTDRVATTADLERKNAALESYVHSVSHDLRSPLVSLLGFTHLLRQDYDEVLGETGRHFADRIEQSGRTMEALIEDLLELAQIGSSNEMRALVDPRSVLQQLRAELKLRLDEAGAEIEIPDTPPLVLCDRTRLYQLFSNLVGNALQHMGPCDDRRIRVSFETGPACHVIVVEDRGRGVSPKDHERIFEVFQTGAKAASIGRSTGVGLAIVKKIAEIHGGRAWVESEPEQGARFCVSLPRS